MRQQLASILVAGALGGCSLIYNPGNLPSTSDAVDAKADGRPPILDADATALALTHVTPNVLLEGQGVGGSRQAILVVHGMQIVEGAEVAVNIHGGGNAMVTVDNTMAQVSDDGYMVAVPVTVKVDPALMDGMNVRLDVTVTQPVPGQGMVSKTLDHVDDPADNPVVVIKGLDELTGSTIALTPGVHEYSQVSVTGGITAASNTDPIIVRAVSSASVGGTSSVNAMNKNGGPGGFNGGDGGTTVAPAGKPGGGDGGGITAGGGGSYGTKGGGNTHDPVGNPQLTSLDAPNRGCGGAGGDGGIGSGGAGGGGGGSIEISAGGTLSVGTIEAKGGNGASGTNNGGGGSGGTILLRSGVSVMASGLVVNGGMGGNMGGFGRIRVDAPGAVPPQGTPTFYRGPTFLANTSLITRNERPSFTVKGERLRTFTYFYTNEQGTNMRGPYAPQTLSGSGDIMFTLQDPLFDGLNTLCVQVEGADISAEKPEARNCIQIVYLYVKSS